MSLRFKDNIKDIEELYKMYLLNKLAESELKDYKQTEFYDKDDRSNKRSYDSKSRKSIFNFDDDLEENFDNEENE